MFIGRTISGITKETYERLFKSNYLSCDYCVNRNCVSNNSVCSECYDNDKYECDYERLENERW